MFSSMRWVFFMLQFFFMLRFFFMPGLLGFFMCQVLFFTLLMNRIS